MKRYARPVALAVIRREAEILVFDVPDEVKAVTGHRPPGGTIEFGERGEEAVVREIREELGAELVDVRSLGTVENIFRYQGREGHEIVLIFEGRLADATLYARDEIAAVLENGSPLRLLWKRLADFGPRAPLYPDGLLTLLVGEDTPTR